MESFWIRTHSQGKLSFTDPQPEDIVPEDIAISLSRSRRFLGHTNAPYTVAEHCIRCAACASDACKREAFAHDFAEAYIGDIPRPLKQLLHHETDVLKEIESRLEQVIANKYNLVYPWPDEVKVIDLRMCATELRDIVDGEVVAYCELPPPYDDQKIIPMCNEDAIYSFFTTVWNELIGGFDRDPVVSRAA